MNQNGDAKQQTPGPWKRDMERRIHGQLPQGPTKRRNTRVVAQVYREADVAVIENSLELRDTLRLLRDWCDCNINGVPAGYGLIMDRADAVLKKVEG
jgi:hypothetical protein